MFEEVFDYKTAFLAKMKIMWKIIYEANSKYEIFEFGNFTFWDGIFYS